MTAGMRERDRGSPPAPHPEELLSRFAGAADCLTHVERVPPRPGVHAPWPSWTPPSLISSYAARGVTQPWTHQVDAATLAHHGSHVVVATGTGSGKSLAYQLPVLAALAASPRATALYLSPTKALAADQLRSLTALCDPEVRPAAYDGDTPFEEREWVRAFSRFVLTNPDMVHRGLLPRHDKWSTFLRRLSYVVIDECHTYRGVFGSHVAHVLRRLRRVCARYGTSPTFILASATSGDPAATASRLIGLPVTAVTEDASPRGGVTFALWEPPLLPPPTPTGDPTHEERPSNIVSEVPQPLADGDARWEERSAPRRTSGADATREEQSPLPPSDVGSDLSGPRPAADVAATREERSAPRRTSDIGVDQVGSAVRRSALSQTSDLLADAMVAGARTLAFVRSRRGAELVATMTRRMLAAAAPDIAGRVAAYRAGYLREERRELERRLIEGDLLGLASTNALELGVDLVGLDAVVLSGYPGTLASMWQQAGRAGRAGRDALCVLVARDDPLDTYLVHHPHALFGRPVEATVLDPANPYVLGPHLCHAAVELPLTSADLALFGGTAQDTIDALVDARLLRRRPTGWYWSGDGRPDTDLRGTGGAPISIVESSTGRLLGTVDNGAAHAQVHTGAVHLHQGVTYVVDQLDLDDCVALVRAEEPDWSTHARDITELDVTSIRELVDAGPVGLFLGEVDVTHQVVSYQRRRLVTGEVIDTRPLDLPERQLHTTAVWWTLSPESLARAGIEAADVPGALHAAEHAAIGLLPLVATCDRWDIGGLSTAMHGDTEAPTIFVYDGHPGGAGFAERAYGVAVEWLTATRDAIAGCGCERGCPSCVQSPKCGNGNEPLDKAGAVLVLDVVLKALSEAGS